MSSRCAVDDGPRRREKASTIDCWSALRTWRPRLTYTQKAAPSPHTPDDRHRERVVGSDGGIRDQSCGESQSDEDELAQELDEMSAAEACQCEATVTTYAGVTALSRIDRRPRPGVCRERRERLHARGSKARTSGCSMTAPGVVW